MHVLTLLSTYLNAPQNLISHLRTNQSVFGIEYVLPDYCWKLILDGWFGFLISQEKITSWACSERSGLKLVFHWYAQLLISSRSLFKALVDKFVSWTTENREVSSPKGLGLDDNSFDNHLTIINAD